MTRPALYVSSPSFIVRNAPNSVAFYRDRLGFEVIFQGPEDDPFFAVLSRDHAMLMVKAVGVEPLPNFQRHPFARWDAYFGTADPDGLAEEFLSRGVVFSKPLQNTEDGLRGFELEDVDGYVLFFGRPEPNPD